MRKIKNLFLLVLVALTTSCATMFTGTHQTVRFESNTSNAKVMLNLKEIGSTNEDISIKRSEMGGLIRISKEGCKTKELVLPKKSNPSFLLNIPFEFIPYGLIAAYIDVVNSANIKTEPIIKADLDCTK